MVASFLGNIEAVRALDWVSGSGQYTAKGMVYIVAPTTRTHTAHHTIAHNVTMYSCTLHHHSVTINSYTG